MYQSLIVFYKQIPEFQQYDLADQILLIKCNLLNMIHFHHTIVENFEELIPLDSHMPRWVSLDFHLEMARTRKRFDQFMKYPHVLQISLIVFIFSINLSTPRGSSQFTDYINKSKLMKSQNFYISLLWRYLNYLFNEDEAVRAIQTIVMQVLRYQTLMNVMDEFIQNDGHQILFDPLTQSVLRLT